VPPVVLESPVRASANATARTGLSNTPSQHSVTTRVKTTCHPCPEKKVSPMRRNIPEGRQPGRLIRKPRYKNRDGLIEITRPNSHRVAVLLP